MLPRVRHETAGWAWLAIAAMSLVAPDASAATWIELHGGAALPQGGFGNSLDAGWVCGIAVERSIGSGWSAGVASGWKQFGGSDDATRAERQRLSAAAGGPIAAHLGTSVLPVLIRAHWTQPGPRTRPVHLTFGLGAFHMRHTIEAMTEDVDQTSTRFGGEGAVGWGLPALGPATLSLEAAYDWMGNARSVIELRADARFAIRR
jgi:hypothetical protein